KERSIRKKVAIIGGGSSGLSALKTFVTNKCDDVILLEAQDRLGGRIQTFRNAFVVREDGSEIKNDYCVFETVQSLIDETDENGILEPLYDVGYGEYFVRRFKEVASTQELDQKEYKAWMHYMEQGTGNWNDISARDADLFNDYGEDIEWKSGYDTLVNYFSKFFQSSFYLLNTPVTKIFWDLEDTDGALIKTNNNEWFLVDKVVVTVSVGCLKNWRNSVFVPPIPDPLRSALQNMELGNSNKIFCGWPQKWWGNRPLSINILWNEFNLPKDKEWLYGIVEIFSTKEDSMLRAFVSGEYSLLMEKKDESEVIHWAGEHTHDSRYGTVDGAVEAGFREANRILNENGVIL
ncbi:putative polyamine oxidase 5, partial [Armadillidium nasatum]